MKIKKGLFTLPTLYIGIFVLIVLLLVIYTVANFVGGYKPEIYIGEIFGKKVSLDDFNKTYLHMETQARMRYGRMFEKLEPFLDLENDAWDQLILLHELS